MISLIAKVCFAKVPKNINNVCIGESCQKDHERYPHGGGRPELVAKHNEIEHLGMMCAEDKWRPKLAKSAHAMRNMPRSPPEV